MTNVLKLRELDKPKALSEEAKQILEFLNAKAGKRFRPVPVNIEMIVARLREGYTPDDLRSVVAMKCRKWKGDERMNEYLRPATLFNRTNCAQYVGELGPEEAGG
jgi:uncharacterized phage protein (TIGR02220 family)